MTGIKVGVRRLACVALVVGVAGVVALQTPVVTALPDTSPTALRLVDGQIPGDLLTIANPAVTYQLDDAIEVVDIATLLPGFVGGINELCVSTNGSVGLDSLAFGETWCDFYDYTALSEVRDDLSSGTLLAPLHTDQKSTWAKNLGTTDTRTLDESSFSLGGFATGVVSVSAGGYHTCAVTSGGAVFCWGSGSNGRLGDGSTTSRSTPVQVKGVGGEGFLSGVVSVSVGENHSCAVTSITSGGAVFCWGSGLNGRLGDGSTTNRSTPVQVKDVEGTGTLSGVVSVSAGGSHTCAVTSGGAVFCWGSGLNGRLGDGSTTNRSTPVQVKDVGGTGTLSGVVSVSAGENHSCAVTSITSGGAVFCWGAGSNGQLGDGSTTNRSSPVQVTGVGGVGVLSDVVSVSAGTYRTCAVTSGGEVFCWGSGSNGQLGDGSTSDQPSPVQVKGVGGEGFLSGVVSVSVGRLHTCAVTSGGAAFCWGSGSFGRLGDGSTTNRSTPVQVKDVGGTGTLSGVVSVSAGDYHTCAVTSGGEVFCWGSGEDGKLGNGPTAESVVPDSVWAGEMPGTSVTTLESGLGTLSWGSDWFETGDCVRFDDTGTILDDAGSVLVSSVGGTATVDIAGYDLGAAPEAGYAVYSDCVGVPSTISVATDQLINGHRSVIVTWYRMPTFDSTVDLGSANTYQVVIIERGDDDFDVEYNYGAVTGDEFSTANVPIGWVSKVAGTADESHEWADTINATDLVDDGAKALIGNSVNSNIAGRYVIPFRDDVVVGGAWTTPLFDGAARFAAGFLPARAPVDVAAVMTATTAEMSWTPGADGVADTTGYTVTASPGGASCTTTGTTCSIVGLTSGVAYLFSVVANSGAGESDAGFVSATTPTTTTSTTTTTPTTTSPTTTSPTTTSTTTTSPTAVASPGVPTREQILVLPLAALTDSTVMLPGATFTATIGGFDAGDMVRLVVASDPQLLGSAVVDASGTVTVSGVIPLDLSAGEHTLAVIDSDESGFRQTITVTGALLPATGSDTAPMFPVLLVALGVTVLVVTRRRTS